MNEAVAWGDYKRVTSLLEEGAPTYNTDNHNRTPIDWFISGATVTIKSLHLLDRLLHTELMTTPVADTGLMTSTWFTRQAVVKSYISEGYTGVIYIISKYLSVCGMTNCIFTQLCVCRAGLNYSELVQSIVERVVTCVRYTVRALDRDVISLVGAIRIFHILTHIRPLYFHNETQIIHELLEETNNVAKHKLVCSLVEIVSATPSLRTLCISTIRSRMSECCPSGVSVIYRMRLLAGVIPGTTVAELCLDHCFGGEIKPSNWSHSYDFVCGK